MMGTLRAVILPGLVLAAIWVLSPAAADAG